MREELNHIELIEKYLLGELKGKELEAFESRLLNDADLRQEVEMQRLFVKGIENAGLKQSLNFIHSAMFESPASFLSRHWMNLLAGGSFCLVIIAAFLFAVFNDGIKNDTKVFVQAAHDEVQNKNFQFKEDFVFEDTASANETVKLSVPAKNIVNKFPGAEVKSFFYSLDPTKDTTIIGREGTIISFPKYCFVTGEGEGLSRFYSVELKEAYKSSEILLNDLAGSSVSESHGTNGSVFVNATDNDKQLKFGPGKNINIQFSSSFPEEKDKEKTGKDNIIYYKVFNDEPEKRLINIPVDVLDYELNYTSAIKDNRHYTTAYAERHMNEKIEGLTEEKYNNTFVSSMQFHYRIEGCQLYGDGEELLDIYLKNTHLKLWEADSLVAGYLNKKALADCKNYGRLMKAEEYFRWLKSSRYGKTVNFTPLEYRNYHKGQIYNKVPHTREIKRLQRFGLTEEEAVSMLNYFKKIYYYKSKFLEARKKNISLDYYYANEGRYVEYESNSCGQAGKQAMELNYYFPVNKLGWINYEKLPDQKNVCNLRINMSGQDAGAYAKAYLVFNSIKYISAADWTQQGFSVFENLPAKFSAYLIGLSYVNDKIYYARKEIVTGNSGAVDLELKLSDAKSIRGDLSVLDK
jgi:hypothetical protein